ncbi:hypothetical protein [Streptomyces sp. NPDC055692]|uniref:hypothetical protein n=1 Tax=Streptomyces sp. NPDC055692 TaxID=3155683 RepID=UPI00341AB2EA
MARCGCGGGLCNCTVQAGNNVTVSGSGSAANPYVVSSEVRCSDVRGCLSGGPGVTFNPSTGQISAGLSTQAGNNLTIRPDGLFVPTGAATVSTGCGLTGNGSGSSPVRVNTATWPYACSPATSGGVIVCDANGVLRGEPRGRISYVQNGETRNYNDVLVPTSTAVVPVDTFSLDVTNPDPCRSAVVLFEREFDVSFNLPAGAGAAWGADGDEMYYMRNSGSSAITNIHSQLTKVYQALAALGPGASSTITIAVELGRGTGGANYNRIQSLLRAILISL